MDPAWISVALTLLGIIITGIVAYQAGLRGTQVAIAVMEQKHANLKEQLVRVTETLDAHAEILGEHGERIAVLERWPHVKPPLDYAR